MKFLKWLIVSVWCGASCETNTFVEPNSSCSKAQVVYRGCGGSYFLALTGPNTLASKNKVTFRQPSGELLEVENVIQTYFLPQSMRDKPNGTLFYVTLREQTATDSSTVRPCNTLIQEIISREGDIRILTVSNFSTQKCE